MLGGGASGFKLVLNNPPSGCYVIGYGINGDGLSLQCSSKYSNPMSAQVGFYDKSPYVTPYAIVGDHGTFTHTYQIDAQGHTTTTSYKYGVVYELSNTCSY